MISDAFSCALAICISSLEKTKLWYSVFWLGCLWGLFGWYWAAWSVELFAGIFKSSWLLCTDLVFSSLICLIVPRVFSGLFFGIFYISSVKKKKKRWFDFTFPCRYYCVFLFNKLPIIPRVIFQWDILALFQSSGGIVQFVNTSCWFFVKIIVQVEGIIPSYFSESF